jgi:hypothetical protein
VTVPSIARRNARASEGGTTGVGFDEWTVGVVVGEVRRRAAADGLGDDEVPLHPATVAAVAPASTPSAVRRPMRGVSAIVSVSDFCVLDH